MWRIPFRSFLDQLMKAMKAGKVSGKPMTKGDIQEYIAESTELKTSDARKMLNALAEVVDKEVKKAGKFTIPVVCRVKTRVKPVTKAGKREMFGQIMVVIKRLQAALSGFERL